MIAVRRLLVVVAVLFAVMAISLTAFAQDVTPTQPDSGEEEQLVKRVYLPHIEFPELPFSLLDTAPGVTPSHRVTYAVKCLLVEHWTQPGNILRWHRKIICVEPTGGSITADMCLLPNPSEAIQPETPDVLALKYVHDDGTFGYLANAETGGPPYSQLWELSPTDSRATTMLAGLRDEGYNDLAQTLDQYVVNRRTVVAVWANSRYFLPIVGIKVHPDDGDRFEITCYR